jgi:transcription initiation factor IIE alpha subunit
MKQKCPFCGSDLNVTDNTTHIICGVCKNIVKIK